MAGKRCLAMTNLVCDALNLDNFRPAEAFVRQAGWNQVEADWRLMLSIGKGWGMSRDGRLVGTVVAIPFGSEFGWISMMLVDKAEQGRGIGRKLMQAALADWEQTGRVAALDATPAGKPLYLSLGFVESMTIGRFAGEGKRIPPVAIPGGLSIRPITPSDMGQILDHDRIVFGADRASILNQLRERRPDLAWLALKAGEVVGYVFGREGRIATQIGPLVTAEPEMALALLSACCKGAPGALRIDIPRQKTQFVNTLADCGFLAERDLFRMWRGSSGFGDASNVFAIAGPELG